jgi:glycosyltransferase involved in cell wall biosynthesis
LISADCKTGPREILLSDNEYTKLITDIPSGDSTKEAIEGEYGILVPDMGENVDMDITHITDEEKILADKITSLLDNPEKRECYAKKAFERALFYTPEKYRDSIHDILETI